MTEKKVSVTKITIEIKGKEISLTVEEAQELKKELNKLLAGEPNDNRNAGLELLEKLRRAGQPDTHPWTPLPPIWPERQWPSWRELVPNRPPNIWCTTIDGTVCE